MKTRIGPSGADKSAVASDPTDLEKYLVSNRQYITLRNLARQTRFNSYRLKSMLKQASVEPLDSSNRNGRNIYHCRDVETILTEVNVENEDNRSRQKT